jgi:hypothetical protein
MKLFKCQTCDNVLYFENRTCGRCNHRLGYAPEADALSSLEPMRDSGWNALATGGAVRRLCRNADHDACNWLTPPGSDAAYCLACRHNGTIPDLSNPVNLAEWRRLEFAKHRLFYSLLRWKLPLRTRQEDAAHGLIFHFLADPPPTLGPKVMTGHDDGLITIALIEADDAEREKRRTQMGEPYRTLLGHFRHEVGHHYWDVLVRDGDKLEACRAVFGDDRANYEAAVRRHYVEGAPPDWQERFVSSYATTHPWEDFAETWAHYLHIVDTLEIASAFGLHVDPAIDPSGAHRAHPDFDPYAAGTIHHIIDAWTPFAFAMNSVNRAMGQADLYPFVLAPAVIGKIGFVHALILGLAK